MSKPLSLVLLVSVVASSLLSWPRSASAAPQALTIGGVYDDPASNAYWATRFSPDLLSELASFQKEVAEERSAQVQEELQDGAFTETPQTVHFASSNSNPSSNANSNSIPNSSANSIPNSNQTNSSATPSANSASSF